MADQDTRALSLTEAEATLLQQLSRDVLEYTPGDGTLTEEEDNILWGVIKKIDAL